MSVLVAVLVEVTHLAHAVTPHQFVAIQTEATHVVLIPRLVTLIFE